MESIKETNQVKFTPRGNAVLVKAKIEKPKTDIIIAGSKEEDNVKVTELTVIKMGANVTELEIGDVISLSKDGRIKPLGLPENTSEYVYGLVDAYMIEGILKY